MCLGELARVTLVTQGGTAEVSADGRTRTVSLLTLEDPVAPGDWVLTHAGFALARLTADEARDAAVIRTSGEDDVPWPR